MKRKPGRPAGSGSGNNYPVVVRTRITKRVFKHLEKTAKNFDVTVATVVRWALNMYVPPEPDDKNNTGLPF